MHSNNDKKVVKKWAKMAIFDPFFRGCFRGDFGVKIDRFLVFFNNDFIIGSRFTHVTSPSKE